MLVIRASSGRKISCCERHRICAHDHYGSRRGRRLVGQREAFVASLYPFRSTTPRLHHSITPTLRGLILEKIPFLILVAASSAVTFFAQQKGETVVALGA